MTTALTRVATEGGSPAVIRHIGSLTSRSVSSVDRRCGLGYAAAVCGAVRRALGRNPLALPALAGLAGPVPDATDLVATLRGAGCVFAEDEARLLTAAARDDADLGRLVRQRVAGTPLEHLLGWVEFDGLRIAVEPGVFVPRRRTELLVREAAGRAPPRAVVVELCCGAGAVAAALTALATIEVYAVDVDPAAVRCARLPGGRLPATSTHRCPAGWSTGWTCSSPTPRTCRPARSA
jgi:hypothetical protein